MKTPTKKLLITAASLSVNKIIMLTVFFIFISANFLFGQIIIQKHLIQPVARAVVNFKQLAAREALLPKPPGAIKGIVPNEAEYEEPYSPYISPEPSNPTNTNKVTVISPSPVLDYEGAPDEAQGGGTSGTYNIPPDTYGAAGLDKVFVTLNNNYRILNKATGASLSLVSMPSFWSSLGSPAADSPFDPRVVYDPYNNRWILAAVSNFDATSRVLLAISTTHDPEGTYNLFAFDPDAGTTLWADFPMLGFNKNWVAISVNLFTIAGGSFSSGSVFAIDYPTLLTGSAIATAFTGIALASGGFCMHPATTYSSTEETLYLVSHIGSASATYKESTITGTPASPSLTIGVTKTRTGGGWTSATGSPNILPQQCLSSCPGTLMFADAGDQYNRTNVIYRSGYVWHCQTVRLPSGGSYTHTAAQWTKLTASTGDYADGGRIDVPTATSSNGEQWYAYPSVAVNSSGDALVGFAKGESDGYLGAAYAMRLSSDAAGTMQDNYLYKDGLDYYEKDFSSGRNRWGDYSHTVVDPVDDASFWTIQEYAKLRAAPTVGGSTAKWGTWWAKVVPNACLSAVASGSWSAAGTWGCGGVPTSTKHVSIISGHNVTLDVDPSAASITVNSGGTLTISSARTLSCKLIVYGTLNITGGKLTLGTNDVFLAEGATLTGASSTSYFVTNSTGKLTKVIPGGGSFEFPVSPNTSSYNALTIAITGVQPDEVFSVRVDPTVTPSSPSNSQCVQRTWNITEMTSGGNSATLTFKWAAAEQGSSFSGSSVFAYRHNGTVYEHPPISMTTPVLSSGIYSSTTVTPTATFSPWIVASTSVLPIVMNYFTGIKLSNNTHKLDWKATCSGNIANFELQRSSDGRNFSALNSFNADYARCLQPFSYIDNAPLAGRNFYRIRIKDEAGKVSYSNVILLLNSKSGFEIVNIQPNPASSIAMLNLSSAKKQQLSMVITDAGGSKIFERNFDVDAGTNQQELNFETLISGTYILTLNSTEGIRRSIKFVKQ